MPEHAIHADISQCMHSSHQVRLRSSQRAPAAVAYRSRLHAKPRRAAARLYKILSPIHAKPFPSPRRTACTARANSTRTSTGAPGSRSRAYRRRSRTRAMGGRASFNHAVRGAARWSRSRGRACTARGRSPSSRKPGIPARYSEFCPATLIPPYNVYYIVYRVYKGSGRRVTYKVPGVVERIVVSYC